MKLFAIAVGAIYQKPEGLRDPQYLKFIRKFPCVGCGKTRWIQAMHTGPHGLRQKAPDRDALPGCIECHQELHQIGPVAFQEKRGIDFPTLRAMHQDFYSRKRRKKAA